MYGNISSGSKSRTLLRLRWLFSFSRIGEWCKATTQNTFSSSERPVASEHSTMHNPGNGASVSSRARYHVFNTPSLTIQDINRLVTAKAARSNGGRAPADWRKCQERFRCHVRHPIPNSPRGNIPSHCDREVARRSKERREWREWGWRAQKRGVFTEMLNHRSGSRLNGIINRSCACLLAEFQRSPVLGSSFLKGAVVIRNHMGLGKVPVFGDSPDDRLRKKDQISDDRLGDRRVPLRLWVEFAF